MNEVQADRLKELYAMLAGVPDERFHLETWRGGAVQRRGDKHLTSPVCKTTACAVGWACAYPPFKKQGLHWEHQLRTPAFSGVFGWVATENFFGLTGEESSRLFMESSYSGRAGPIDVMARVRRVLYGNGFISQERADELLHYEALLRSQRSAS